MFSVSLRPPPPHLWVRMNVLVLALISTPKCLSHQIICKFQHTNALHGKKHTHACMYTSTCFSGINQAISSRRMSIQCEVHLSLTKRYHWRIWQTEYHKVWWQLSRKGTSCVVKNIPKLLKQSKLKTCFVPDREKRSNLQPGFWIKCWFYFEFRCWVWWRTSCSTHRVAQLIRGLLLSLVENLAHVNLNRETRSTERQWIAAWLAVTLDDVLHSQSC